MKNNKGITLIALIITIIVMLILVAVTITIAVNGGLFNYAREAGIKTNEAKDAEQKFAEIGEGLTYEGLIEKYSGITAGTVAADPARFYGATVTGYTWPNQNNEDITWRIFHSDGQNIYLIAADYVKYAPDSENNSITVNSDYCLSMDDVISDYSGGTDIASSKAKKWIDDYLTSINDNMKAVAYMLDNSIWDTLYKGINAEYSIGGPTLKMFVKSYNATHENKIAYITSDDQNDYGYKVKLGNETYTYYLEELDSRNNLYYIPWNANIKAYKMWLASPPAADQHDVLDVNDEGNLGSHNYDDIEIGFRPIVCLKSDVALESVSEGVYRIK